MREKKLFELIGNFVKTSNETARLAERFAKEVSESDSEGIRDYFTYVEKISASPSLLELSLTSAVKVEPQTINPDAMKFVTEDPAFQEPFDMSKAVRQLQQLH